MLKGNPQPPMPQRLASLFLSLCLLGTCTSLSHADSTRLPASPESEPIETLMTGLDTDFCADWNPEFQYRGFRCCYAPKAKTRHYRPRCAPGRVKTTFCDEMTDDQRRYTQQAADGKLGDVLELISHEASAKHQQAYCNINNGFLVRGRRLIPSATNRVRLKSPTRCIDFGTDPMIGMIEWVGRKVAAEYAAPEYAGVHFLVGDISAPRGGCLSGRSGRRGHVSHTSGQDVDLGFLNVRPGRTSPIHFSRDFDAKPNWWLTKQIFANPFACVKVVFLDRKLIRKLAREAGADPEWARLSPYIRHVKYHKNHYHVRVGEGPGVPGCKAPIESDEELQEEMGEEGEEVDVSGGLPKPIESVPPPLAPSKQAIQPALNGPSDTARLPAGSAPKRKR